MPMKSLLSIPVPQHSPFLKATRINLFFYIIL